MPWGDSATLGISDFAQGQLGEVPAGRRRGLNLSVFESQGTIYIDLWWFVEQESLVGCLVSDAQVVYCELPEVGSKFKSKVPLARLTTSQAYFLLKKETLIKSIEKTRPNLPIYWNSSKNRPNLPIYWKWIKRSGVHFRGLLKHWSTIQGHIVHPGECEGCGWGLCSCGLRGTESQ